MQTYNALSVPSSNICATSRRVRGLIAIARIAARCAKPGAAFWRTAFTIARLYI
jgi:hypothetical protein